MAAWAEAVAGATAGAGTGAGGGRHLLVMTHQITEAMMTRQEVKQLPCHAQHLLLLLALLLWRTTAG